METAQGLICGTAKECLSHYFAAQWNGNARIALADLAGCNVKSVGDWTRGKIMPRGENLLRVMHYLAFLGYKVIELDRIDPDIRYLGQMILLGICATDDLAAAMGYTGITATERRSDLYRVLLRAGGMAKERTHLVKTFVAERAAGLKSAIPEFEEKLPRLQNYQSTPAQKISRSHSAPERVVRRPETVQARTVREESNINIQVSIAVGLVQSLLRHVQLLTRHKEEMDAFRKSAPEIRELGEYLLAIASDTI